MSVKTVNLPLLNENGKLDCDTLGNAETSTKLKTTRTLTIKDSDGSHSGEATSFNGTSNVDIKLPETIKASIVGNCSGSSGSCTGNSATATNSTHSSDAVEMYREDNSKGLFNTSTLEALSALVSNKSLHYIPCGYTSGVINTLSAGRIGYAPGNAMSSHIALSFKNMEADTSKHYLYFSLYSFTLSEEQVREATIIAGYNDNTKACTLYGNSLTIIPLKPNKFLIVTDKGSFVVESSTSDNIVVSFTSENEWYYTSWVVFGYPYTNFGGFKRVDYSNSEGAISHRAIGTIKEISQYKNLYFRCKYRKDSNHIGVLVTTIPVSSFANSLELYYIMKNPLGDGECYIYYEYDSTLGWDNSKFYINSEFSLINWEIYAD